MKNTFIWAAVAVVVLGGVWAIYKSKTPSPSSTNAITIGAVLSQTGSAASYGEIARNAIHMAADDINAQGGIDGRRVEVVYEDDQTDPQQAVSAFQKLTSVDKVDAAIGGVFDFVYQPLLPIADTTHTALVSPETFRIPGSLELTDNSFTMLPTLSSVVRELKTYIASHKTQQLGIVHLQSAWGADVAATLASMAQELGQPTVINESYEHIDNNDFKTTILKLKAAKVDTVFLDMVDVDPVTFLTQARQLNFHPTVITYPGLTDSFAAPGADKSLMEGAVVLDWEFSAPEFSANYQKRFGTAPTKSAGKAYAAVYVLAQAVAKAHARQDVAGYVASHSFVTPLGNITFNAQHSTDSTPVRIEVIKNGVPVALQ